jgi:glycopeptide antibiotics resistance protein
VLSARHYTWLALGFLVLAVYGSLVPLRYQPMPLDEAVQRFRNLRFFGETTEKRSDFVANVLLFIPLAYLLMGALCVDRRRRVGLAAAAGVVAFCTGLSLAIEFVQAYFPPRTQSINDIVAESAGGIIGTLVWLGWGQQLTEWGRRFWAVWGTQGVVAVFLPGYLAFLLLVHVMPLDLTISPAELYRKYKEGKVNLVPFRMPALSLPKLIDAIAWKVAYFLPLGLLLAFLRSPRWRSWQGWPRVLLFGLLTAALFEVLQLFVWTRNSDVTDVILGGLSVLGGWTLVLAARQFRKPGWQGSKDFVLARPGIRAAVFVVWLAVAVTYAWGPFDFNFGQGLGAFRRVLGYPFADYYWTPEYQVFDQVLRRMLLFAPLGALLVPTRPAADRRCSWLALLAGLVLAAVLECGQLYLPGRYAGITDVLLQPLGAWAGFGITRWLRDRFQEQSVLDAGVPSYGRWRS